MDRYEEGMKILDEKFGNNKDNIIALATLAQDAEGNTWPITRDVDAYYEDGCFYVVTHSQSGKMQQIAQNNRIGISVNMEWFNGTAFGENLGWVLDPKNADVRDKLRKAFVWYDNVNNEQDENCCFLAIKLRKGIININHFEKLYIMNFMEKTVDFRG